MQPIKIATAQFENRSGDKAYNLSVIDQLSAQAAQNGAQVITFHECCISGYSYARKLSKTQLLEEAEFVPDGESIQCLIEISKKNGIVILAGLFEKDKNG
ncbi:MAG TPA: nitrilase, partial [Algoriphagus sp.]|nr:nitrilase [Algoriphagus sp.]